MRCSWPSALTSAKHVDIPARDAARVLDAVTLLRESAAGDAPRLGRRVVVYGGGNTAMDAARTARRLGADEALIVYRRDRAHMPAHAFEADEALEEGVKIRWLTRSRRSPAPISRSRSWSSTPTGRPHPDRALETLAGRRGGAGAWARRRDSGFLQRHAGIEFAAGRHGVVGPNMMTGHPGVFAGGDMVAGERTVTVAVGHGKRAARHIDAWLRGAQYQRAGETCRS